jgi:RHS repeat-associated protein
MPGRKFNTPGYRYGFNGKEKDGEVNSIEGAYDDFGARMYDARLGRWMKMDPLEEKYAGLSPFNFCASNPILYRDPDGRDIVIYAKSMATGKMVPVIHILTDTENDLEFCFDGMAAPMYGFALAPKPPTIIDMRESLAELDLIASILDPDALIVDMGGSANLFTGYTGGLQMVLFLKGQDQGNMYSYWYRSEALENLGFGLGVGVQFGIGKFNYNNGEVASPDKNNYTAGDSFFIQGAWGVGGFSYSCNTVSGECNPWHTSVWDVASVSAGVGPLPSEYKASAVAGCSSSGLIAGAFKCAGTEMENINYLAEFKQKKPQFYTRSGNDVTVELCPAYKEGSRGDENEHQNDE